MLLPPLGLHTLLPVLLVALSVIEASAATNENVLECLGGTTVSSSHCCLPQYTYLTTSFNSAQLVVHINEQTADEVRTTGVLACGESEERNASTYRASSLTDRHGMPSVKDLAGGSTGLTPHTIVTGNRQSMGPPPDLGRYGMPGGENIAGVVNQLVGADGRDCIGGRTCEFEQRRPIGIAVNPGVPDANRERLVIGMQGAAEFEELVGQLKNLSTRDRYRAHISPVLLAPSGGFSIRQLDLVSNGVDADAYTRVRGNPGSYSQLPSGRLERVSRNYIRGWACPSTPSKSPALVYLYGTNVSGCPSPNAYGNETLCLLTPDPVNRSTSRFNNEEDPYRANPALANIPRESVVQANCNGVANGFQFLTPDTLLDSKSHKIYAFSTSQPSPETLLAGGPLTLNSNTLYVQEQVYDLRWNTFVHYKKLAHTRLPEGVEDGGIYWQNGLKSQPFGFNTDRTIIALWNMPTNPIVSTESGRAIPGLADRTGIATPSLDAREVLGMHDGEGRVTGLQAQDTTLGFSLAYRGFTKDSLNNSWNIGPIWPLYKQLNPFAQGRTLKISGYFRHPFSRIRTIFSGKTAQLIYDNGWTAIYYGLVMRDYGRNIIDDRGKAQVPTVWTEHFMFASQLSGHNDTPAVPRRVADQVLLGNSTNVYLASFINKQSAWLTPCQGSATYSSSPYLGERYFCFTISPEQFRTMLVTSNAGLRTKFSTDPADYSLVLAALDIESSLPRSESDVQIGGAMRDVVIELMP